jgi:hypothetical protein
VTIPGRNSSHRTHGYAVIRRSRRISSCGFGPVAQRIEAPLPRASAARSHSSNEAPMMTVSPASAAPPAVKHRRHAPLIIGLVMMAVVAASYAAWQHSSSNSRDQGPWRRFRSSLRRSGRRIFRSC